MPVIERSTMEFLSDLKENNYREWFSANRPRYEKAKKNFEEFVQAIIAGIILFDPDYRGLEAKNCIFRINRDTRFSHDKSPYKTNFGAFLVRNGKINSSRFPGYYIHLEPGGCFLAGGAYIPPAPWLNAIRERIDDEGEQLLAIVADKQFARYFGGIEGEKLKTVPKGYAKDHPYIELLKYKSYLAEMSVKDTQVLDKNYLELVNDVFRAMKPLNDFLTV